MKKTLLYTLLILLFLIVWNLFIKYSRENNVEYQISQLESSKLDDRMRAIDWLGNRKILDIIPFLVRNIDIGEFSAYKNKSPESVSCVSTLALTKITNKNIWYTCCYAEECKKDNMEIIQKWKDWYSNEYPAWLEQQKQNGTM